MDINPDVWRKRHDRMGRAAYEAYAEEVGGVSVAGDPLPTWDEMVETKPDVAHAWRHAAMAVVRARDDEAAAEQKAVG